VWIKLKVSERSWKLWLALFASGSTEMLPTVCSFGADKALLSVVEEHINARQKRFKEYFGSSVEDLEWVRDPFGAVETSLPLKAQQELTDIKADRTLRLKFHENSLDTFWLTPKE
jgi:hypothetical protein